MRPFQIAILIAGVSFITLILLSASLASVNRPEVIIAAFISSSSTIVAALGGIFLWRLQDRRESEKRLEVQEDNSRKMMIASSQEIDLAIRHLTEGWDPLKIREQRNIIASRLASNPCSLDAMPFAIPVRNSHPVLNQVINDIVHLPKPIIRKLVKYYQNALAYQTTITAFHEGSFDKLEVRKRILAVDKLLDQSMRTLSAALEARCIIDAFLESEDGHSIDLEDFDVKRFCSHSERKIIAEIEGFGNFEPSPEVLLKDSTDKANQDV